MRASVIAATAAAALLSGPAGGADFESAFGLYNGADRRFVLEPRFDLIVLDENDGRFFAAALERGVFRVFLLDDGMRAARPYPAGGLPVTGTQFVLFGESRGTREDVRVGMRTQSGQVVIPATMKNIDRLGFSLYLAQDGDKHRVYDGAAMKWLDLPAYDQIIRLPSSEAVGVRIGKKFGLLSASGREALPVEFDGIRAAPGGYVVMARAGKQQLYTVEGRRVLDGEYDWVAPEPPGLVWFGVLLPGEKAPRATPDKDTINYPTPRPFMRLNYRVGLMRLDGTVLIEPVLEGFGSFRDGFATVRRDGKADYIDRDGNFKTGFRFNTVGPFIDGLAPVSIERRFGIINREFTMVVPAEYIDVGTVTADGTLDSENDGLFAKKDGRHYHFFDSHGRKLVELEASQVQGCNYKLRYCRFVRDGKVGLVSHLGEILLEPEFDEVQVLAGQQVAVVRRDKKWGAVRYPGGAGLLELKYEKVDGRPGMPVLVAEMKDEYEVLNLANGERRPLPKGTKDVDILSPRYLRVTTRIGARALLDVSGRILIEPRAQKIEHLLEDLFLVER
jgi:hypothetical protein